MEENKEAIHEYMKKEAMERYRTDVIKMAQEDPELKALLDGHDESTAANDPGHATTAGFATASKTTK